MRTLKTCMLLTALVLSSALIAQTSGEIKGKVIDLNSKEPVPYASVYVEAAGQLVGTITSESGKFTIKPLNPGIYNVTIQFTGYDTIIIPGVRVDPDKISFVETVEMGMSAVVLKGAVVRGEWKDPLINPEEVSKMTISRTQIEKNPNRLSPLKMASAMIPGVTESADGQGLHFRGSRTSAIAYFIDGVKQADNFTRLPASAIGSMTVYTGGLPAKYGDVTGGVIIIETKSYFDYYNEWLAQEEVRKLKEEYQQ